MLFRECGRRLRHVRGDVHDLACTTNLINTNQRDAPARIHLTELLQDLVGLIRTDLLSRRKRNNVLCSFEIHSMQATDFTSSAPARTDDRTSVRAGSGRTGSLAIPHR